jgi:hypothetical protein
VPEVLACAVPSVIADVSEIAGLPATPSPLEMESGALTVIVRLVNVSAAVSTTSPAVELSAAIAVSVASSGCRPMASAGAWTMRSPCMSRTRASEASVRPSIAGMSGMGYREGKGGRRWPKAPAFAKTRH